MLLWFADLMNITEEVTIHTPNVSTLLSSACLRRSLLFENFLGKNAKIRKLISFVFTPRLN